MERLTEVKKNFNQTSQVAEPFSISVKELWELGPDKIPDPFIPNCHLIYSSPQTLAYNSPGALGFGTKRAGLTIPESAMLLVSPSCCGRNSTILSQTEGYAERMFYLLMSESDLVTGNHLKKIPQAIRELLAVSDPKPKVVLICFTCADALLATDLEAICKQAQAETGVYVVPTYMYALEREGEKPPMVAVYKSIYSLLERLPVQADMVNLMGYFSPVDPRSDLFSLLDEAGIHQVKEAAAMDSLEEYMTLGAANFNLVLDPLARYGAEDLMDRLGMPFVELVRLTDPDQIHRQYQLFAGALGIQIRDGDFYDQARARMEEFAREYQGTRLAIGEMVDANPYDLAATMAKMGMEVAAIFANLTEADYPFIRKLASLSPDTRVYTGISPTMTAYKPLEGVDLALGRDAMAYVPTAKALAWDQEVQPYGFVGFLDLLEAMEEVLQEGGRS